MPNIIKFLVLTLFLPILFTSCKTDTEITEPVPEIEKTEMESLEIATFAGGCFWCMEAPFEKVDGVSDVKSGYTGGDDTDPTYSEVSSGTTGHQESIKVYFDPKKVSYKTLLDVFWRQINPTDDGGQYVDRGFQYTSGIFYHTEEQKKIAEQSKKELEESGRYDKPIITPILPAEEFYLAEDYHQDYHTKNPIRYNLYRAGSGRDKYLNEIWGDDKDLKIESNSSLTSTESTFSDGEFVKPSDDELKKTLTSLQYKITQEDGTEKAFDNEYWDNKEEGIYVDIVSGEPLFSSQDKYKSGTGWPSFTKTLENDNVVTKKDFKLIFPRTEVRSKNADSHLGHLFNDGPAPTGQRYCLNSAALKFIPKEDLEKEGYEEFMDMFV